jgi:hypothetical protein
VKPIILRLARAKGEKARRIRVTGVVQVH